MLTDFLKNTFLNWSYLLIFSRNTLIESLVHTFRTTLHRVSLKNRGCVEYIIHFQFLLVFYYNEKSKKTSSAFDKY
jgi:hypothetical protein